MDTNPVADITEFRTRTALPGHTPASVSAPQAAALAALITLATPLVAEDPPAARVPASGARTAAPAAGGGQRPSRGRPRQLTRFLPLLIIITVQAGLTARLIRGNTAFQDEGLYLWAGHLEIAHWLHGTPIPPFPTFFSGAPVLYPPLGAAADALGGLAAARGLSAMFMCGATVLLYATTRRLYGPVAAVCAAGGWAVLGPTLHLGAFATYDAMSLFLVAVAAWCATAARGRDSNTGWIIAAAVALTVANATKYASTLFDPAVIALAWLAACPVPGGKPAARRAALLATCTLAVLVAAVRTGGLYYQVGIRETTLSRAAGTDSAGLVLRDTAMWGGAAVAIAAAGAVTGLRRETSRAGRVLLVILAGTGLLAPLEQARIHTTTSLDKHVDFGVWFAMMAAGYAVAALITAPRRAAARAVLGAAATAAAVVYAAAGFGQARDLLTWPAPGRFLHALAPYTARGRLLVETPSIPEYYLPAGHDWDRWSSTWNIRLPGGKSTGSRGVGEAGETAAYLAGITGHYWTVIALNGNATPGLDAAITARLKTTPGYRVTARIPYGRIGEYVIWVDADPQQQGGIRWLPQHHRGHRAGTGTGTQPSSSHHRMTPRNTPTPRGPSRTSPRR